MQLTKGPISLTNNISSLHIKYLDDYTKDDQERKILEMSEVIEEMSWEELKAVLTIEMLDRIDEMLEEKKLSVENAVCLMKKIGYSKVVKNLWNNSFNDSLLRFRLEKLMLDEEKKMREMNEQFLVEVCECYILLRSNFISQKLLPGCTCSLLKAAMNKEESEGAQKEVEMALLALSNICVHQPMAQELFMYEILEIIEYHQEHHNLTRLGYQSAWGFLISRLYTERSLETVITYKLNFAREVVRELEELSKHIDWKKKEEERRGKVREEAYIFVRWILTLNSYFCGCEAWNGGLAGIVRSIVGAFREAKDNYREISDRCIFLFERIANMQAVQIDELLSGGAVDVVVEETVSLETMDLLVKNYLSFFRGLCRRLKNGKGKQEEEATRKENKRRVFEKMEEKGYDDCIFGLFFITEKRMFGEYFLIQNLEDYFIFC